MSLIVGKLYYSKTYVLNRENVPSPGTATLIVSDHQNSLNDALGFVLSLKDRKLHCVVRADAFKVNPLFSRIMTWAGLVPISRLNWEGLETLKEDIGTTFAITEKVLEDGNSLLIFPEAGHQDHHWLGPFTSGYTKIAFEAAEKSGFEREVFILPSCNHYSNYFGFRTQALVKYGKPLSLKPYYEKYREAPRTTQKEVSEIVHRQISDMMLDIRDNGNYEAIDFIREALFGAEYALEEGLDPKELPQKLEADKKLVSILTGTPGRESLYADVMSLKHELSRLGVSIRNVRSHGQGPALAIEVVLLAAMLPAALACALPFAICSLIPLYFTKKIKDKMFQGTFILIFNIFLFIPLLSLIIFVCSWIWAGILTAVAGVLLFPLGLCFEWFYLKLTKRSLEDARWIFRVRKGTAAKLRKLDNDIVRRLRDIVKT